jgi:hypothetical protein
MIESSTQSQHKLPISPHNLFRTSSLVKSTPLTLLIPRSYYPPPLTTAGSSVAHNQTFIAAPLLHIHAREGSHFHYHKQWILQHIRQAPDRNLAEDRRERKVRTERMSSALIRASATVSVDFPAARRDIICRYSLFRQSGCFYPHFTSLPTYVHKFIKLKKDGNIAK